MSEKCGICSSKVKPLVSSAPAKDLIRRLNKAEQEKRRKQSKYEKRFNRIQRREKIKVEIEDISLKCDTILKPSFKMMTQSLIEDKTKLKKTQQEKLEKQTSVMSHQRKNKRMEKYIHQVKHDARQKGIAFKTLDFKLIDSRIFEAREMLQVHCSEFDLNSTNSDPMNSMIPSFCNHPFNPLSRISGDEDDVDNEELLKVAKLTRIQQFITCLNSIMGPRACPLPAQMPPKKCFKLKPSSLMAGVKLNIDESHFRTDILTTIPFDDNNVTWVEEDEIIEEGWESLEITEAGEVVSSRSQSSYLSSLWTWATSNPS